MNLTVLLIAAFLPLPVLLFMILRSGSFGKGSIGTMLKLFFLGVASAVPAFLMEAGCLLVISVFLGLFPDDAFGGNLPVVSAVLRCFIAAALIEEGWKLFVLRASTWKQMIMENITDGIAASALVGTGFSAVMYGAWQAAYYVIPAHMEILREALPEFLGAGAVTSFLVALLYIFSHGKRAGFMFFFSGLLPILLHGFCAALSGYGIAEGKPVWVAVGLALEAVLALLMAAMLGRASDAVSEDFYNAAENQPVDFADSEEFASFAESQGNGDQTGNRDEEAAQGSEAEQDDEKELYGETVQDDEAAVPDVEAARDDDAADPGLETAQEEHAVQDDGSGQDDLQ